VEKKESRKSERKGSALVRSPRGSSQGTMILMDIPPEAPAPKRGDLVQTNVGNKRERTWFIVSAVSVKTKTGLRRFRIFMVRWWLLDPEMRIKLWNSAERRGGQQVIRFKRYPAKKRKRTFEQYMGGW
jgi:hypothetical protein